jgi:hypothetical protein
MRRAPARCFSPEVRIALSRLERIYAAMTTLFASWTAAAIAVTVSGAVRVWLAPSGDHVVHVVVGLAALVVLFPATTASATAWFDTRLLADRPPADALQVWARGRARLMSVRGQGDFLFIAAVLLFLASGR